MGSHKEDSPRAQFDKRARWSAGALTAVAFVIVSFLYAPQASAEASGWVRGEVEAKATGVAVAGAEIILPDYGLRTLSLHDGSFSFPQALSTALPYRRIRATVIARGYGRWALQGAPLYPGDTLILHAEVRPDAYTHSVLTPEERFASPAPQGPLSTYTYTCTGWKGRLLPPSTINVFITDDGVAKNYDFTFYVTHVLPDEWIPSWDADSLGAGSVAVKTYAAYRALPNHAYSGGVGCADIVDSSADQVFDPTWSTAATDQAVYATLGSMLKRDGELFLSQYFAGTPGDPCAPVGGQFAGRMSQWGTQTCALESVLWPDIVTTFYESTYWTYVHDLLLNPGAENTELYPWLATAPTTFVRSKGGAYENNWYLTVSTQTTSTLYQVRPFNGDTNSAYHLEVALRCGPENASSCKVTLKVIANAANGSKVVQSLSVVESNDDLWRLYTFDPPASGIAHVSVQVNFVTKQTIGLDAATLTGPFGGP
jgi:hypothetical protein